MSDDRITNNNRAARPRNHRLIALIAGLLVAAGLVLPAVFSGNSKSPVRHAQSLSSPVATRDIQDDASQRSMAATFTLTCRDIADSTELAYRTGNKALRLTYMGGNNSTKVHFEDLCEYKNATDRTVAQTSYQVVTYNGYHVYSDFLHNQVDNIVTRMIPASELPKGASDGYYFTPADMPADMASPYRNPGFTVRVNDMLVTVSFKGFDKLSTGPRKALMNYATMGPIAINNS